MIKAASSFLTLALLLWVLPLGAFIKASQEKTACGGGRAFHMCAAMAKVHAGSGKVSIASSSSAEKTQKSASSSGNDLLLGRTPLNSFETSSRFFEDAVVPVRSSFFHSPDPVPKPVLL